MSHSLQCILPESLPAPYHMICMGHVIDRLNSKARCILLTHCLFSLLHTGDMGSITVGLRDAFNNTVADADPSALVVLIRHATDAEFEPQYLRPEGMACGLGETEYRCCLLFAPIPFLNPCTVGLWVWHVAWGK